MEQNELKRILEEHRKWVCGEEGGSRANLSVANLSGANLSGANLSRADLSRANLSWTNLSRANLSGANLSGANLSWANLSRADLQNTIYAVSVILRAYWYLPPDAKHLTLELMAHDAESCGINAMNKWAEGKAGCPFFEHSERDFYFKEDKGLWLSASPKDKIPKLRGRKLLEALCEACKVKL
jgi:hypothetical protein